MAGAENSGEASKRLRTLHIHGDRRRPSIADRVLSSTAGATGPLLCSGEGQDALLGLLILAVILVPHILGHRGVTAAHGAVQRHRVTFQDALGVLRVIRTSVGVSGKESRSGVCLGVWGQEIKRRKLPQA